MPLETLQSHPAWAKLREDEREKVLAAFEQLSEQDRARLYQRLGAGRSAEPAPFDESDLLNPERGAEMVRQSLLAAGPGGLAGLGVRAVAGGAARAVAGTGLLSQLAQKFGGKVWPMAKGAAMGAALEMVPIIGGGSLLQGAKTGAMLGMGQKGSGPLWKFGKKRALIENAAGIARGTKAAPAAARAAKAAPTVARAAPEAAATPAAIEKGYVYHATNAERLEDIASAGKLKTYRPSYGTDQRAWPDGAIERRAYFGKTAEGVRQFAPEHGQAVVVRTKVGPHIRRESTGDLYTREPIKSDTLEYQAADGSWIPVSSLAAKGVTATTMTLGKLVEKASATKPGSMRQALAEPPAFARGPARPIPAIEPSAAISRVLSQGEYDHYGIRVLGKSKVKVGETLKASREFLDDKPTGAMVEGGTSVVEVTGKNIQEALERANRYGLRGNKVVLVGSNRRTIGRPDLGEVALENPKVLAVLGERSGSSIATIAGARAAPAAQAAAPSAAPTMRQVLAEPPAFARNPIRPPLPKGAQAGPKGRSMPAENTTVGAHLPAVPATAGPGARKELLEIALRELKSAGHRQEYIVDKLSRRFGISAAEAYRILRGTR